MFHCKDDQKLEHALGREFHITWGRSVPLRVHQINSVVSMLRQKLQLHKRTSLKGAAYRELRMLRAAGCVQNLIFTS
ncbi:hypothetical protein F2Q70_00015250 [Brassica cretica]|uniref:U6 snRNA phosphodiesterase 1 n=1 Tax=Brassica cretica TaxID=69181 RepID=A0A8S9I2R5_BRACR|nr:hypothetical protein F2Q70_00015250 [Brassica cretica]